MSKKELTNLKRRIKYANSHLNTTLGLEKMQPFIPSKPVNIKNIRKISRELKKWQSQKKIKQKIENFAIKAFKYNNKLANKTF